MTTKRQQFWIDAAEKEGKRRNDLAATLFWLIAQPSDAEQAEAHRADGDEDD